MESRRVLEVADASTGTVTTFGEPAPYITTEELGRLAADYRDLMDGATAVVLCGSLPDGLPPETYGTFATYAAEAGVPAILDAGGSALMHGLARRPALAVPELSAAGAAFDAGVLIAGGVGAVAYASDDAVRVVTAQGEWHARLAAQEEPEPAWSRDAMVAGFVPGIALGWSWPDMLAHTVALAGATLRTGEVDLDAYERRLPAVRIDARAPADKRS
jgi:tagatose 6-phosphate kinase